MIALRAVKNQAVASSEVGNSEKFGNIARILVVQATILLAFTMLAGPVSYLLLWVLPLVTLTPLLITLRVIAEHQSVEYALSEIEKSDQRHRAADDPVRFREPGSNDFCLVP